MWLIDFCHRHSSACLEMAESCGETDTERRKAWVDLAKEWSRLPEETVLRKAGAGALVQAIMKSRADEPVAAVLESPRNASKASDEGLGSPVKSQTL
jgi:hypothetical protein